jgi:hypothetical protein
VNATVTSSRGGTGARAGEAKEAGERGSEWAARLGFAARGVLWLLLAILAIQVATGHRENEADRRGALGEIVDKPFGRVLVAIVAIGFLGLAAWKIIRAIRGSDDAKPGKRVAWAAQAVVQLVLFGACVPFVLHGASEKNQGGSSGKEQTWTQRVLEWPGGRWIVAAAGLAVLGAAGYNLYKAVTRKTGHELDGISGRERVWAERLWVAGRAARGVVYALVGFFLVRAAIEFDPNEPIGLDESLRTVVQSGWGEALVIATGVGLILYALVCFAQARWRTVEV